MSTIRTRRRWRRRLSSGGDLADKTASSASAISVSRRTLFAISYTATLLAVAFLLVCLFAKLEASDSSPSQAHRVVVAQDVTTVDAKKDEPQQRNSPVARPKPISGPLGQHAHLGGGGSAEGEQKLTKPTGSSGLSILRQTRATTRKQTTTTSTASTVDSASPEDTAATQPASSPASSSTASNGSASSPTTPTTSSATNSTSDEPEDYDLAAVAKEIRAAASKRGKKKHRGEEEPMEEEEPEDEEELERQRRRKLMIAKTRNRTGTGTSQLEAPAGDGKVAIRAKGALVKSSPASSEDTTERSRKSSSSSSSSSPSSASSTSAATSTSATPITSPEQIGERPKKRKKVSSNSDAATSTMSSSTSTRKIEPSLDHESFDYPDEEKVAPLDFSKVKLVGLNEFNGTTANTKIEAAQLASIADSDLEPLESANGTLDALNPRSPSAQPGSNLAKRISSILSDQAGKHKLYRPTTSTTTPAPKFAYSKPYSSTTMMTSAALDDGMLVQVINQTSSGSNGASNSTGEQLDWSKLVKVVFKSAKDNHTIYTVVMNSSELSNHPINDWSSELPHLLQRDFEKLIQKWSNVFPIDHLMTDLGKIIVNKISASPANITIPLSLMGKLNESPSQNRTATSNLAHNVSSLNLLSTPSPSRSVAKLLAPNVGNSTNSTNDDSLKATIGWDAAQLNSSLSHLNASKTLPQEHNTGFLSSTNSSLTMSSPKSINISVDSIRSTTPWSSIVDLSTQQRSTSASEAASINQTSSSSASLVAVGPDSDNTPQNGSSIVTPTVPMGANLVDTNHKPVNNRSLAEMIRDMNKEHIKIEDNVKEQANSLRHFIIICSISTVLATSLVIALVILLSK